MMHDMLETPANLPASPRHLQCVRRLKAKHRPAPPELCTTRFRCSWEDHLEIPQALLISIGNGGEGQCLGRRVVGNHAAIA